MLTTPEKILFTFAVLASIYATGNGVIRIIHIIGRGKGKVDWSLVRKRLVEVIIKVLTQQPSFRLRIIPSIFHIMIVWGFTYYLLINIGDAFEGYISDFHFMGVGRVGDIYRLVGDVLSVLALIGMVVLIIRRFLQRPSNLTTRDDILLYREARTSIKRDSLIVGGFILFHVGTRFLGESFFLAANGTDPWQPFVSFIARYWMNWPTTSITIAEHLGFWFALGSILLFFPYFPYSKHIHLFFAPINFLIRPERQSPGQLDPLDFEDESIESFGVTYLEEMSWSQILDAYACIMCYRCQEVCPAYNTGKVLSPAALEINKRYYINKEGHKLAEGAANQDRLLDFAISEEAVWACTACGACTDICPTGNDPMRDIMDIRRAQVLMENKFPDQLQTAYRGMERTSNPWNIPPTERLKWAEGLNVPTIEQNPEPDYLWWVGCAPATDPRAQKIARAFAEILNESGVNFAVLGEMENCTGDSARRSGNEYLFYELALMNVETLNQVSPKQIITTCPHCLHTIQNEYGDFGGKYDVLHHTELISNLLSSGKLALEGDAAGESITFHDPCYLGRQNYVINDPRLSIKQTGAHLNEMERTKSKSFCCGAGGAQMWKEEEQGFERVSQNRLNEAQSSGAEKLAVGCPFCMIMLEDVNSTIDQPMEILDIAEVVAARLKK
jgi:Fe-S oxidoreductase/nitrate reductase gamma subunit